jgi:hypothetical protein
MRAAAHLSRKSCQNNNNDNEVEGALRYHNQRICLLLVRIRRYLVSRCSRRSFSVPLRVARWFKGGWLVVGLIG